MGDVYPFIYKSLIKNEMKMKIKMFVLSTIFLGILALPYSCTKDNLNSDNLQYASILSVAGDGVSTVDIQNLQSVLVETLGLTEGELSSLIKMKEEEKLARDVYSVLHLKWGNSVFSKISAAENNHLNAILLLLQSYGVPDTLAGEAGVFMNEDLQNLYARLVTDGSMSVEDAWRTGALIEEMDISDLNIAFSETSNENIGLVYENLLRGSNNHLRAFYNQLASLGIEYVPQYITQEEYNQIVSTPMEKGRQYKMQGKGQGTCDGTGIGKGMRKQRGRQ
jgi:hypothetical protein